VSTATRRARHSTEARASPSGTATRARRGSSRPSAPRSGPSEEGPDPVEEATPRRGGRRVQLRGGGRGGDGSLVGHRGSALEMAGDGAATALRVGIARIRCGPSPRVPSGSRVGRRAELAGDGAEDESGRNGALPEIRGPVARGAP
jgi:hypothetical protein